MKTTLVITVNSIRIKRKMYNKKYYRQQAITITLCTNYEIDVFGMVTS